MGEAVSLSGMPDTLTADQLCQVLGISKDTWGRWRKAGVMPIPELQPPTHRARYSKRMVEKYLETGRRMR